VLQRYVEDLLLYQGRKWDIRVWVLATDSGDVAAYRPGYIRTSSQMFDPASTDRYAHLTNYCQQVHSSAFGSFEAGNTLSFDQLAQYLTGWLQDQGKASGAGAHKREFRPSPLMADSPGVEAQWPPVDGPDAMWGRLGIWVQICRHIRNTFESLRGRGGVRSKGFEEDGFARKPAYPGVALPPAPSLSAMPASVAAGAYPDIYSPAQPAALDAKTDAAPEATGAGDPSDPSLASADSGSAPNPKRTTGDAAVWTNGYPCGPALGSAPGGTRHRFELLGYDFILDEHLQVHFIEVNTNPSLTYQCDWHEVFADKMAREMLDIVLPGVLETSDSASGTRAKTAEMLPFGFKLPIQEGWQFLMNVYTSPKKPSGGNSSGSDRPATAAIRGRAQAKGPGPDSAVHTALQKRSASKPRNVSIGRVATASGAPAGDGVRSKSQPPAPNTPRSAAVGGTGARGSEKGDKPEKGAAAAMANRPPFGFAPSSQKPRSAMPAIHVVSLEVHPATSASTRPATSTGGNTRNSNFRRPNTVAKAASMGNSQHVGSTSHGASPKRPPIAPSNQSHGVAAIMGSPRAVGVALDLATSEAAFISTTAALITVSTLPTCASDTDIV
jgi:hypothetical protein